MVRPLVIHVDRELVAVAKLPGETVIPGPGIDPAQVLRSRLERERGERLWVVHRLDAETSGIVVLARSAQAHRALGRAFEMRQVEKYYLAFAAGTMPAPSGRIDMALHTARKGRTRPARPGEAGAREAVTDYRVLQIWATRSHPDVSMLELRPRTGRHHQIRVHLRAIGAPILFDTVYGKQALRAAEGGFGRTSTAFDSAPCRRLALHAWRLVLPPLGGRNGPLSLEAPLPPDLQALSEWLDLNRGCARP